MSMGKPKFEIFLVNASWIWWNQPERNIDVTRRGYSLLVTLNSFEENLDDSMSAITNFI